MNTNGATMCPIRSTKRRMTCVRPNQKAVARHRANKTSSMAMICHRFVRLMLKEHDVNSPLSAPMDNVIEAMEMRFCRSPMSWPPPRRNRTHCLIPRISGMNLKLRSAARLASCHHAAARQRQRRRPHETSVATTPRRSGPRALAPRRSFGLRPTRLLRRSWLR